MYCSMSYVPVGVMTGMRLAKPVAKYTRPLGPRSTKYQRLNSIEKPIMNLDRSQRCQRVASEDRGHQDSYRNHLRQEELVPLDPAQ
jgi:hypothetical protein